MTAFADLLPTILDGVAWTAAVFLGASMVAVAVSIIAGLLRLSAPLPFRWLAVAYIEVFRGTSALVQLFWFYFVLPRFGIILEPVLTGIFVLGLNYGAYGAEIVRGAIKSVPGGQYEACLALNMTVWQRFRRVVFPQAVVAMLPPIGNLQIELLKNVSLVYFIGITGITYQCKVLQNSTQRTAEIFGLALVLYFVLALLVTCITRLLEHFLGRGMHAGGI
jgi:polar amino acid transport system permease protein